MSFEPADALSRAVNVRFADLPVYEIDPGERSDQPVTAPGTEVSSEQEMSIPTTEGAAIAPGATASPISEPERADSPDEVPAEKQQAVPIPTPDVDEENKPITPSRAESRSPRRRRETPSGGVRVVWIVLPLLAVLAVAAIWILQRPAGPDTEPESLASRSSPAVQAPESGPDEQVQDNDIDPAGGGDDTDPSSAAPTDERPDDRSEPTAEQGAADDEAAPRYPLDRSVEGYTMIVGSSPDRTAADEQISRFTELDLPYGVLDYSEDGSPMFRLAVGLFDSVEQADSARQSMADTLPSGTWVWRIR